MIEILRLVISSVTDLATPIRILNFQFKDVNNFIEYLIQIRELLNVQLETYEEVILKHGLWQLMNNRIFFQHPDLMRLLRIHRLFLILNL